MVWQVCHVHVILLTAGLCAAQLCPYCIYSVVQKYLFCPTEVTHCPDKREIWHSGTDLLLPMPNCTFIEAEMWEKTVKISNFARKFTPDGQLVCTILLTKF